MEVLRDRRALHWLADLARVVSFGLRAAGRSKGFTGTALLSPALGICANGGIFSLLDQVLLRSLPVPEPERLVQLEWRGSPIGTEYGGGHLFSYPVCRELAEQEEMFDGVFCRHPTDVYVSTGRGAESV